MQFEDLNLRTALAFSLQAAYMGAVKSSIYDPDSNISMQMLNKLDDAAWEATNALTSEESDELMKLKWALWGVMLFAEAIRDGLDEDLETVKK